MYLDSSALVKLYVREPESDEVIEIVAAAEHRATVRLTLVEVRRALARALRGSALAQARAEFALDWEGMHVIDGDAELCERAAELAELTQIKTLDALHLAAAEQSGGPVLTYHVALARAARSLGWTVVGA